MIIQDFWNAGYMRKRKRFTEWICNSISSTLPAYKHAAGQKNGRSIPHVVANDGGDIGWRSMFQMK